MPPDEDTMDYTTRQRWLNRTVVFVDQCSSVVVSLVYVPRSHNLQGNKRFLSLALKTWSPNVPSMSYYRLTVTRAKYGMLTWERETP